MRKSSFVILLCMTIGLVLTGCAKNNPDEKGKIAAGEVQEVSAYVGSDACITCHTETGNGFVMTSHAAVFKPLDTYHVNWNQKVTVWDDTAKENPRSREINLQDSAGVMMDDYVIAKIAGFANEYYRVAVLEKTDQGYKLEPVSLNDYNADGTGDWGAKAYTCAQCHSPGLTVQNSAINDLETGISCETCHGPGSIHVQTKKKEAISISKEACISCHTLGEPSEAEDGDYLIAENHYGTRNWFTSAHYTSGYVNCLNCHTSHQVNPGGIMLNGTFAENCGRCHKDQEFNRDEIMWKNPTDAYNHITRDHSFGAVPYDQYGDNPGTKELEIINPETVKKLKALKKDAK
ncbi:MAG: multiheme c-type cytochrome [Peptococcaceae bacterium]